MLDCYECDAKALDDLNVVHEFLDKLPDKIGMTKITRPYVFRYEGPAGQPRERGITGVIIIAESHISIHTFPEKGYLTMDAYSCKPFDPKLAIDFVKQLFKPTVIDKKITYRGRQEAPVLRAKPLTFLK